MFETINCRLQELAQAPKLEEIESRVGPDISQLHTRTIKTARILALMEHPNDASLADLTEATGWLPHTTRAGLTVLWKKGHAVANAKTDSGRRYRIHAEG